MNLELDGSSFVVTGASSGIGRATVLALAGERCRLAIGARRAEELDAVASLARGLGVEVVSFPGDLTMPSVPEQLVECAIKSFGRLDGVISCVGSTPIGTIAAVTDEEWTRSFETKLLATIRLVRAALVHLGNDAPGGRVVMVAGNSANVPGAHMVTSGAINAALNNLAAALSREYGAKGVGVVCVNPGPVRTARYDGLMTYLSGGDAASSAEADLLARISDRRIATPEEVGQLIAFLASPLASHLSGTSVVLDGGQF